MSAHTLTARGALLDFYEACLKQNRAITPHLPRLRALADGCRLAVEFGVKYGASSSALLLGADHVISYDITETPDARRLQAIARNRWDYRIEDSRTATFPHPDLLFIDSQHDYQHLSAELIAHAGNVSRLLVFHDTVTFGSIGADGESGRYKWTYQPGKPIPLSALGIRHAIDELMIRSPSWRIMAAYPDSHGLLVLERRGAGR